MNILNDEGFSEGDSQSDDDDSAIEDVDDNNKN